MRPVGNKNTANSMEPEADVRNVNMLPSLSKVVQKLERQGVQVLPLPTVSLLQPSYFRAPLQLPTLKDVVETNLIDMAPVRRDDNRYASASVRDDPTRLPSASVFTYSQNDDSLEGWRVEHASLPSIRALDLPLQPMNREPKDSAATLPSIHETILQHAAPVRFQPPGKRAHTGDLEEPAAKSQAREKPRQKWVFIDASPSAGAASSSRQTSMQADQQTFMAGMRSLTLLLTPHVESCIASRILQKCEEFEQVYTEVKVLSKAAAKSLLTIAQELAPKHKAASEVLATLWLTLGYAHKGAKWDAAKVKNLLRQDSSGKPIWPAALGNDVREECRNKWLTLERRNADPDIAKLALELCGRGE